MDATDSSPRRTSSIIRRFSSIERSRLPPRVSVCFASSSVDVSISSPKWTRTPCPSLRTHHRRMRCQGSDGGDRTLTVDFVLRFVHGARIERESHAIDIAAKPALVRTSVRVVSPRSDTYPVLIDDARERLRVGVVLVKVRPAGTVRIGHGIERAFSSESVRVDFATRCDDAANTN